MKKSGRLGTTTCQVLVRYLPRDFPIEELMAYVSEMLGEQQVQVTVLWRRTFAAFVVTAHRRHQWTLLDVRNWEEHVRVSLYHPTPTAAAVSQCPDSNTTNTNNGR